MVVADEGRPARSGLPVRGKQRGGVDLETARRTGMDVAATPCLDHAVRFDQQSANLLAGSGRLGQDRPKRHP